MMGILHLSPQQGQVAVAPFGLSIMEPGAALQPQLNPNPEVRNEFRVGHRHPCCRPRSASRRRPGLPRHGNPPHPTPRRHRPGDRPAVTGLPRCRQAAARPRSRRIRRDRNLAKSRWTLAGNKLPDHRGTDLQSVRDHTDGLQIRPTANSVGYSLKAPWCPHRSRSRQTSGFAALPRSLATSATSTRTLRFLADLIACNLMACVGGRSRLFRGRRTGNSGANPGRPRRCNRERERTDS